ncbi:MAG: phospholipid carrier-dependent glycosyltransferase [Planctomycetota bacterium]
MRLPFPTNTPGVPPETKRLGTAESTVDRTMGGGPVDGKGMWPRTIRLASHPLAVLAVAIMVRIVVAVVGIDRLADDPDSYRKLAETVARLGIYGRPDPADGQVYPTAYRPPLYPLLLACLADDAGVSGPAVAIFHVVLGVGTVALVLLLGESLGLGRRSALAGVLVACDPILMHQATLVMTETLAAFLGAVGMVCAMAALRRPILSTKAWHWPAVGWTIATGASAGVAALCRPTFLPWLACLAFLVFCGNLMGAFQRRRFSKANALAAVIPAAGLATLVVFSGLVIIAPWAFRNSRQMGRWIMTTTHGGYTLLLGNNPDYYEWLRSSFSSSSSLSSSESLPWQLPSDDYLMERCRQSLATEERTEHAKRRGVSRELAEDALAGRCAQNHIAADWAAFGWASWRRLVQFWSPLPHATRKGESAAARAARYAVAVWYVVVGGFAAWGAGVWLSAVVRAARMLFAGVSSARQRSLQRWAITWSPLMMLVICFAAAHTVYWSNLRMRGPIMPAVCLLATVGCGFMTRGGGVGGGAGVGGRAKS